MHLLTLLQTLKIRIPHWLTVMHFVDSMRCSNNACIRQREWKLRVIYGYQWSGLLWMALCFLRVVRTAIIQMCGEFCTILLTCFENDKRALGSWAGHLRIYSFWLALVTIVIMWLAQLSVVNFNPRMLMAWGLTALILPKSLKMCKSLSCYTCNWEFEPLSE